MTETTMRNADLRQILIKRRRNLGMCAVLNRQHSRDQTDWCR